MIEIRFRRLKDWPGTKTAWCDRKNARFKAPHSDTMDLLDRELHMLGAYDVVIETYHKDHDIRLDGWPRSNAGMPEQPGVVISFGSDHGPLRYPCDRFTHWKDNLRAIALALEALRRVDRYGVCSHAEQYRGWSELPSPDDTHAACVIALEALLKLSGETGFVCGVDLMDYAERRAKVIKQALKNTHPEMPDGSDEAFKEACKHKALVEGYFGIAV